MNSNGSINEQRNKGQIRLLLSPKEAAQALAISERTLWQMTKDGVIESIKVGTRSVRYPVAGLERWIAEQAKKSAW
ncbi:MAG: helix-turn-helix domain-containing protein [Phycisphaeraceae bacterium]|nr:helix-turn-helix domain-containing protein [Phycisphaeraceae bacterium]